MIYRNAVFFIIFLFSFCFDLAAQENIESDSESLEKVTLSESFKSSDLKNKLRIIDETVPCADSYDLFSDAVEFAVLNRGYYKNNPFFDEISIISATGIITILNDNKSVRRKISDEEILSLLGFVSGIRQGIILPHLFRMKNTKYPQVIRKTAGKIFREFDGPFFPVVIDILENNPVSDKLEIYAAAMESTCLTSLEKGEISTMAMDEAFNYKVVDHKEIEIVKKILISAVVKIYELSWSEGSFLVLKYFDQLIAYENTALVKEPLLTTIKTLGILGTHEAAVRLNMYIGLINSFVETGLDYDSDIVLEVIISLGRIGDIVAYENLSNMDNLGYCEEIRAAASEAVSKLSIIR